MQNKISEWPKERKIEDDWDLYEFIQYLMSNVQSELTTHKIWEYIKKQNRLSNNYNLKPERVYYDGIKPHINEFEKSRRIMETREGRRNTFQSWKLKGDTRNLVDDSEWEKLIMGKKMLEKFGVWYLTVKKRKASSQEMINYIEVNNLLSKRFPISEKRILGVFLWSSHIINLNKEKWKTNRDIKALWTLREYTLDDCPVSSMVEDKLTYEVI